MEDFSQELEKLAYEEVARINSINNDVWILFVEGVSDFRGEGLSAGLKSPQGDKIIQFICCDFKVANNEVEYETLI